MTSAIMPHVIGVASGMKRGAAATRVKESDWVVVAVRDTGEQGEMTASREQGSAPRYGT
jgi:hypothetical protein